MQGLGMFRTSRLKKELRLSLLWVKNYTNIFSFTLVVKKNVVHYFQRNVNANLVENLPFSQENEEKHFAFYEYSYFLCTCMKCRTYAVSTLLSLHNIHLYELREVWCHLYNMFYCRHNTLDGSCMWMTCGWGGTCAQSVLYSKPAQSFPPTHETNGIHTGRKRNQYARAPYKKKLSAVTCGRNAHLDVDNNGRAISPMLSYVMCIMDMVPCVVLFSPLNIWSNWILYFYCWYYAVFM